MVIDDGADIDDADGEGAGGVCAAGDLQVDGLGGQRDDGEGEVADAAVGDERGAVPFKRLDARVEALRGADELDAVLAVGDGGEGEPVGIAHRVDGARDEAGIGEDGCSTAAGVAVVVDLGDRGGRKEKADDRAGGLNPASD